MYGIKLMDRIIVIRFFDHIVIAIVVWIFVPLGLIILVSGLIRYRATKSHIDEIDLLYNSTKH